MAVGVADQNGFNNDNPAKAATVFQKDLPGTPRSGEVLVRHSAAHNTWIRAVQHMLVSAARACRAAQVRVKQRPINPSDLFCLRGELL